ncbi:MAG TPA: effector-associated domain EAD1-containing protein, partial [Thermoanaerobaculia bacterium]|nr:effector-associated domain EAD1-containing protein [Thermoanaerobaculia bacterium]
MPFDFEQRKALLAIVSSMFSTIDDFRTFLRDATGRKLDELAVGTLVTVRSRVIDRADEQEWLGELVEALKGYGGEETRAKLDEIDARAPWAKSRVTALRVALPNVRERLNAGPE